MSDDLTIQISANDLTGQAFANVQKQLGDIAAASQASAAQMGALSDAAGTLAQKGADLAGFGSNVVSMLRTGAIVGAIGLAINELKAFHEATIQSIAQTVEQAAALSMTAERFQVYTYALAKAGLAQGEVASTLDRQRQQQKAAMDGNAAAIDGYNNLGVKILDANGKLRDYGAITAEVARAILAMTDTEKQAAAARDMLGLSGLRAIPALKQLSEGTNDLERSARAAHAVLSEELAKSIAETTVKSTQASLAVRGFYAEVAMPIQMSFINFHVEALAKIILLLKDGVQWTREFYAALAGGASVAAAQVKAGLATMDEQSTRARIAQLEKQIAEGAKPNTLEAIGHGPADGAANRMAGRQEELARLKGSLVGEQWSASGAAYNVQQKQAQAAFDAYMAKNKAAMDAGQILNGDVTGPGAGNPITKPDPGKGGGGEKYDRIQTAINRLEGEREAAEAALKKMMAGSDLPLKDLENAVALQKKIADEVARIGAHSPDDPRIAQIREEVIARETAEQGLKKYTQASHDAEQTEKSLGDGMLYLRTETQKLNEQLASGRLDWDTYAIAMQQTAEKAEDLRLKNIGLQGGFEGLVAGIQNAANQYERSNRVFQNGQKIFDGLMSTMDQALADFVQKGEVNFGKLAGSFALMIAQMELKAAASAVWGAIGGFGGIAAFLGFGGGSGTSVNGWVGGEGGAGGAYGAGGEYAGGMLAFADGGDPPVGVPSWVGEQGPELFVPKGAGTIFNRDQLAGMGGDGGVTINQTMHFGSDVKRSDLMAWAEQTKNQTIAAVIDARRRGGKMKTAFA